MQKWTGTWPPASLNSHLRTPIRAKCVASFCATCTARGPRLTGGRRSNYSTTLVRLGFAQGVASPNVFRHATKGIACSVHGDDFTSSGPADALDWFETSLEKEYELSIGPRLGPGPGDAKESRALNRGITWREDRIDYEADPRQAELLFNNAA